MSLGFITQVTNHFKFKTLALERICVSMKHILWVFIRRRCILRELYNCRKDFRIKIVSKKLFFFFMFSHIFLKFCSTYIVLVRSESVNLFHSHPNCGYLEYTKLQSDSNVAHEASEIEPSPCLQTCPSSSSLRYLQKCPQHQRFGVWTR